MVRVLGLAACCNYFSKNVRLMTRMDGMLTDDQIEED